MKYLSAGNMKYDYMSQHAVWVKNTYLRKPSTVYCVILNELKLRANRTENQYIVTFRG